MRIFVLCYILILVSLMILPGTGLTDLDYGLGKSKYGKATVAEEGFHGPHSALLSVGEGGSSIKVIVYVDEPMALDEMESFSLWSKPVEGDGKIKVDMYLDGDGDGKWSSKSISDAKLYATSDSWTTEGWQMDDWTEIDALDLNYKKSGYSMLGEKKLCEWQKDHGDLGLVKVYISLYKVGSANSTCYIDYIMVGDQILSFEPLEDLPTKTARQKSISPGSKISYNITYGNDLLEEITNLVIVENYDPRTVFLFSDPAPDPGTNNVWTIGRLSPGQHGQIKIQMIADKQKIDADITGSVSGEGYISVRRRLSTERPGYNVTNRAIVSCDQWSHVGTATVAVKPVDETSIEFSEHGCGCYSSTDDLRHTSTEIFIDEMLSAERINSWDNLTADEPSSRALSGSSIYNATIYNSSWFASHTFENDKTKSILLERYMQGERLCSNATAEVRSTRSFMETESNFTGLAEFETRWKDITLVNILSGSFSVNRSIDERGR
jgi:hypothetical protein